MLPAHIGMPCHPICEFFQATRPGGTVLSTGLTDCDLTAPMMKYLHREIDLRGVHMYCNRYVNY